MYYTVSLEILVSQLRQAAFSKLGLASEPAQSERSNEVGGGQPINGGYYHQPVRPFGHAQILVHDPIIGTGGRCQSSSDETAISIDITDGNGPFAGQNARLVLWAPSLVRALRTVRPLARLLRKIAQQQRVELAKKILASDNPMALVAQFGGRPLRVLSVFSGISAFSAATSKDKFELAAVAECGPTACCTLTRNVDASRPLHMPNPNAPGLSDEERTSRRSAIEAVKHLPDPWTTAVVNLGDVTQITDEDLKRLGIIDILEGGPPCQAFSSAGNRKGMNDPRGELSLTWVEILDRMRKINHVQYAVFENVPGILSGETNPWGNFLRVLAGFGRAQFDDANAVRWDRAGYFHKDDFKGTLSLTWRCLDSQYFGSAQRRLRLFAVASFGNRSRDRRVLHERPWCGWHFDENPYRERAEEAATGVLSRCLAAALSWPGKRDTRSHNEVRRRDQDGRNDVCSTPSALEDRDCAGGSSGVTHGRHVGPTVFEVALQRLSRYLTILAGEGRGCVGIVDRTQVSPDVMPVITARTEGGGAMLAVVQPSPENLVFPTVFPPLMGSAAGLNRPSGLATEAQSVVIHTTCFKPGASESAATNGAAEEIAPTLLAGNGGNSVPAAIVALLERSGLRWIMRRLMPTEAEVLQGFPKGWTDCPIGNRTMFDTDRYKLIGNSVTTVVYWWIFERLWRAHILTEYLGMDDIPESLLFLPLIPFTGKDITLATRESYWRERSRFVE